MGYDAFAGAGPRLLKERDYLLFWVSRWTGSFAAQIQSVAMGWQMYALARLTRSVQESAFLVGMIGLAAFIPVFLLTLPAGETADRHDRKKVLLICLAGEIATVLTLAIATWQGWASRAAAAGRRLPVRRGARLLRPGQHRARPHAGAARAAAARHRLEFAGLADRLDHGPGGRRLPGRRISPAAAYFTTFGLYLAAVAGLPS